VEASGERKSLSGQGEKAGDGRTTKARGFLFPKESRSVLGTAHSPINCVSGALFSNLGVPKRSAEHTRRAMPLIYPTRFLRVDLFNI